MASGTHVSPPPHTHTPFTHSPKASIPPALPGVVREMSRMEPATLQGTGLGHPKGSDVQIRPPCPLVWREEERQRLSRVSAWNLVAEVGGQLTVASACRAPTWQWWTPS